MGEEIHFDEDFAAFWLRVVMVLPGKGRLPSPDGTGIVEAGATEVSAALRKDGSEGLSPTDPAPARRVLSNPSDSIRRGFGRRGVQPGYVVAAPVAVLAADDSKVTPPRTVEPGGLVEIGPVDRRVVLGQIRADYLRVLAGESEGGGTWG